jgi:hypothetical protein
MLPLKSLETRRRNSAKVADSSVTCPRTIPEIVQDYQVVKHKSWTDYRKQPQKENGKHSKRITWDVASYVKFKVPETWWQFRKEEKQLSCFYRKTLCFVFLCMGGWRPLRILVHMIIRPQHQANAICSSWTGYSPRFTHTHKQHQSAGSRN